MCESQNGQHSKYLPTCLLSPKFSPSSLLADKLQLPAATANKYEPPAQPASSQILISSLCEIRHKELLALVLQTK